MQKASVSQKGSPLVLSGIALLILAVGGGIFLGIPALQAVILSWKDYRPVQGLLGSPWVGLENYQTLFSSLYFWRIVKNSLIFWFFGSVLPVLAGGALGFVLSRKAAGRKAAAFLACWLLPVFLPELLYAYLAILGFGAEFLTVPAMARLVTLVMSGFRVFCFAVFLSGIGGLTGKTRGFSPGKAALLGTGAVLALVLARAFTSSNLNFLLQNPLTYETMDTLDNYCFRQGLYNMAVGASTAGWVSKWMMQLPGLLLGAVLLIVLMKKQTAAPRQEGEKGGSAPAVAAGVIICAVVLAGWIFLLSLQPGFLKPIIWLQSLVNSLFAAVISCVLFAVLLGALLLACYRFPVVGVCLGLFFSSLLNNWMAGYLFYRELSLYNTLLGTALWTCWNGVLLLVPLSVIGGVFDGKNIGLSAWLRRMLPFFLLFFGLFAALSWGGWMEDMILISGGDNRTLPLLLQAWMVSGVNPNQAVSAAGEGLSGGITNLLLVYSLVPLLIGGACVTLFGFLFPKEETAS